MNRVQFEQGQSAFSKELRRRVQAHLESRQLSPIPKLLATVIILAILTLYYLLLQAPPRELVILELTLLGIFLFLGGTHVLHEGTHGNLSPSPTFNRGFITVYEIIACFSADQYRLRHLSLHHAQPNVGQLDNDLHAKNLLRFSPAFPHMPHHRFQYLYAPFLYSLGIIQIAWIEDLKRLFTSKLAGHAHTPWKPKDIIKQVSLKLAHFTVFLALPLTLFPASSVLLAYLYVYLIGSLGIALIFQVTHVNTLVEFPSVDESMRVKKDWYEHQIATAINYAPKSRLVLFLTGGVNLQIEHHLFPSVSFLELPHLRSIVKKTAKEFHIPYHECASFTEALGEHFKFLKTLGMPSR
ncbi:MAG: fatty acid desaturase [Proteobacteria bacterium]|jgi:linoleoyl-CoA desaturase|nr:fatty acid desaturase [Pseudomonadota bacterium]